MVFPQSYRHAPDSHKATQHTDTAEPITKQQKHTHAHAQSQHTNFISLNDAFRRGPVLRTAYHNDIERNLTAPPPFPTPPHHTCAYKSVSLAKDSRDATRSRLSHAPFGVAAAGSTPSRGACLEGDDANVNSCGGAKMAALRRLRCPRLFCHGMYSASNGMSRPARARYSASSIRKAFCSRGGVCARGRGKKGGKGGGGGELE